MRRMMSKWRLCCVVLNFTFICEFVTCEEIHVTPPGDIFPEKSVTEPLQLPIKNRSLRLKSCAASTSHLRNTIPNGFVQLPTLVQDEAGSLPAYLLLEHTIDVNNPMGPCRNVNAPEVRTATLLTKTEYDELANATDEEEAVTRIFLSIRNKTFLLDNGILSVGRSGNVVDYYSPDEFCVTQVTGQGAYSSVELQTCRSEPSRIVFPKCCPVGFTYVHGSPIPCVVSSDSWAETMNPEYLDGTTLKSVSLSKVNPIYTYPRIQCNSETQDPVPEFWDQDWNCNSEFHPTTDNRVAYIGAARNWEFIEENTSWCMDSEVKLHPSTGQPTKRLIMYHCVKNHTDEDKESKARISTLYLVTMYTGAFFHFFTTLVYLVTWTKQNIHGKTLCSCTASLFLMQVCLGTAHLFGLLQNQKKTTLCIVNSIAGHYFMIAAFTWVLVVNIDLWRTFRSIRSESGRHLKRFLGYSATGWGFPLLVTIVSVSLHYSFQCRYSLVPIPEYGVDYCFVAPWAQGIYVYYILGVLSIVSWILAGMTFYGLYTYKKEAVNLRSNRTAEDQQNIILFLKLTVVMGLTWIFEVISWLATRDSENSFIWIVLDLYNALSAILIFIIFVCKRTTITLLEQTIPQLKGLTVAISKLSSTFTGDSRYSDNNTASTAAGMESERKKSTESQSVDVVRYTKAKTGSASPSPERVTTSLKK